MDLVILIGGFGKRLSKISNGTPKALLSIGNNVYLDFLLDRIMQYNINHIFLSLYYKSELFIDYINSAKYKNIITPIIEPEPLDTGGAVNYVIENSNILSPLFVINGDTLSEINLDQMLSKFYESNVKAMIGISRVEDVARYGTVVEQEGEVLSFEEKGVTGDGWINNGHYIIKKEAFDSYSGAFSLEKNLFPKLLGNQKLGAFKVVNDNFIDMGVPDDYKKLCNIYDEVK